MKLAPLFADFAGVAAGTRVLDVGCEPGALSEELARRVGAAQVAGLEPSPSFVEACRGKLPAADIQQGSAEHLPWRDGQFDVALAQLVLSFVADAAQVIREMRRVVREGGTIGACMWLEGDALQMGALFWEAVAGVDPSHRHGDASMRFRKRGEIASLLAQCGLLDVEDTVLEVRTVYQDFDDFWGPITTGAGSIGAYMAASDEDRRVAVREACRTKLGNPTQPFELSARACAARGRV